VAILFIRRIRRHQAARRNPRAIRAPAGCRFRRAGPPSAALSPGPGAAGWHRGNRRG